MIPERMMTIIGELLAEIDRLTEMETDADAQHDQIMSMNEEIERLQKIADAAEALVTKRTFIIVARDDEEYVSCALLRELAVALSTTEAKS